MQSEDVKLPLPTRTFIVVDSTGKMNVIQRWSLDLETRFRADVVGELSPLGHHVRVSKDRSGDLDSKSLTIRAFMSAMKARR